MNLKKHILIYIGLILFSSCGVQIKLELLKDLENSGSKIQIIVENTNSTTYKGWWIYGDEQHIFKRSNVTICVIDGRPVKIIRPDKICNVVGLFS